jgi:hypothetical protein
MSAWRLPPAIIAGLLAGAMTAFAAPAIGSGIHPEMRMTVDVK